MKQLYIFILALSFGCFGFAQVSTFQIELVNSSVGQPVDGPNTGVTASNDEGLNIIFDAYDIYNYQYIYPDAYLGENGESYFCVINCYSSFANQLVLDLKAYSSVVRYAVEETVFGVSMNVLNLSLVDPTVGILTGTNAENLITTNDAGLTQIFEDFSVRRYVQYPLAQDESKYSLVCDCDAQILKTELTNYNNVISSASDTFYAMLLSVEEEIKTTINIHPNPFKDEVNIEIDKPVESIMLYDILGKQVYKSSSIVGLENFSSTLESGIYLLKLTTSKGESMTKKLVKS